MREAKTLYFDRPGPANTPIIVKAAVERALELDIGYILVASSTGATARQALAAGEAAGYRGQWVVIGSHVGFREPGRNRMDAATRRELEERGVHVFFGTHALSSVSRSFRLKWGGIDMLETIAEVLRLFSPGIKVCIEMSVMAADAGLVPVDQDIVAIAGTGGGADSSLVLRPANQNRFFELKIREIIGKPR
ncbi:MAG: hypothetical protein M1370_09230 [Bacteroidetes bacterium]|nr:hypothetical protein [Bacteroidota bacterium]MCL5024922.1 hypothetical protein [Chloroflexota bacterium]